MISKKGSALAFSAEKPRHNDRGMFYEFNKFIDILFAFARGYPPIPTSSGIVNTLVPSDKQNGTIYIHARGA
jgi:hypothetical protein